MATAEVLLKRAHARRQKAEAQVARLEAAMQVSDENGLRVGERLTVLEREKAALVEELISCKVFLTAPGARADRHAKIRSIDAALKEGN